MINKVFSFKILLQMGFYLKSNSSDMYLCQVDSEKIMLNKLIKLNDEIFQLIYIINFIKSVCLLITVLS